MRVLDAEANRYASHRAALTLPQLRKLCTLPPMYDGSQRDLDVDLLTTQDVAEVLTLAERSKSTMATDCEIPAFILPGQSRVRRADPKNG